MLAQDWPQVRLYYDSNMMIAICIMLHKHEVLTNTSVFPCYIKVPAPVNATTL